MGVEPEEPPQRPPDPRNQLLGFRNRAIMGVLFATLFIVTYGPRTGWLPGVVSGLLGGAVVFLLLKEVDARRKRRERRDVK